MVIGLLAPFTPLLLKPAAANKTSVLLGTFCGLVSHCDPQKVSKAFVGWLTYAACHTAKWLKSSQERLGERS
jgi:hypothetical protein